MDEYVEGTTVQGEADAQTEAPAQGEVDSALTHAVERYRELLIASNPDIVPELVQGADIEALDGSLETAKAAYARAREAARSELASGPMPSNPQRRGTAPMGLEQAGPLAKIAWGLREQ